MVNYSCSGSLIYHFVNIFTIIILQVLVSIIVSSVSDVKIIIGWDKSELRKERELANSSMELPPACTSKIKLN